jgi:hypothetical protein
MQVFKPKRGSGYILILTITLLYNLLIIFLISASKTYELSVLLKVLLVVVNIYQFYYFLIYLTISYAIDNSRLCIKSIFGLKNVNILLSDIKAYDKHSGPIKGIRISGYGWNHFAIGKSLIEKIGTTYMYATSNKSIIYLNTEEMNYGISPELVQMFEDRLIENGILKKNWSLVKRSNHNFYRDKKFFIPLIIDTILLLILTLNPVILYLRNMLPATMPITFNASFLPVTLGTGKQFAFRQMTYGILNMAIFFCMYYAAHFYSKYDRKSAYKFMYLPLILTIVFILMQIRIIDVFK